MCTRLPNQSSPAPPQYVPASPQYVPVSPEYSPASPQYVPVSPEYSCPAPPQCVPASPQYVPVSPEYSPASPKNVPVSSDYSPASPGPELPEYCLASNSALQPVTRENPSESMMHREFHAPTQPISLSTPGETQASTSGLSPMIPPGFWRETCQYPLKEELNVLNELVDSVRMDLLQTSMLTLNRPPISHPPDDPKSGALRRSSTVVPSDGPQGWCPQTALTVLNSSPQQWCPQGWCPQTALNSGALRRPSQG
nr:DNA-directed RNA polymerase II subunit RPB1-like [Crassostrea gigas]